MMNNKEKMFNLVRQWHRSKPMIRKQDFCKKHQVNIHRLNHWIKRYNKEAGLSKGSDAPVDGFVPLTIKESLTRETGTVPEIELDLSHGIRLRIY